MFFLSLQMCLVGTNVNQFKMLLFKTVWRNRRCCRIREKVASGPLCPLAPEPPACPPPSLSVCLSPPPSLPSHTPSLPPLHLSLFLSVFSTVLDFCRDLSFRVCSEIVFTRRWLLSAELPVSVPFGQSALLSGRAISAVPSAPFPKEARKVVSMIPRGRLSPTQLIRVDAWPWMSRPYPFGPQAASGTMTLIRVLGSRAPRSGRTRGQARRFVLPWRIA